MRSAIYHHGRSGAALALLFLGHGVGTAALAADAPIAEAWVEVAGPYDLRSIDAVGLTVAEGRRALPHGGWEQRVLAPPDALDALIRRGFAVRVERADHRRGLPGARYRPPADGDAVLADLAASAPRAGVVSLGVSVEGRPIRGLWVGQAPEAGAPTLRVLAAHHGDEWSSFEVALDVARALCEGDGHDPRITGVLDRSTVWVVPYVNPDGVVEGSRYNARGVDLNRNYDVEWSPWSWGGGDGPFSEPETRAVRSLAAWSPPLASLSLHGGAENVGYPWNYTSDPTPEEGHLEALATAYADRIDTPGFYATNGADWYRTNGDTNDWSYGRYGGMDFTVEISDDKAPDEDDLDAYVTTHREAILAFLAEPPTLVGRVVDADSGDPVEAFLTLERDGDDPVDLVTTPTGGFARLAAPGAATLHVWAPGYAPAAVAVSVGDGDLVVPLDPVPTAPGEPSPRLVSGPTTVTLPGPSTGTVRLVRPSHGDVIATLSGGAFVVDPAVLAPGPWSVVLPDGTAWPKALIVQGDAPARLDALEGTGSARTAVGAFAEGTRAWALVGPRRAWHRLPILHEDATRVTIATAGVPAGNADLVLVSNGTWLGVADAFSGPDPGDTGADTGAGAPPLVRGTCSCGASPHLGGAPPARAGRPAVPETTTMIPALALLLLGCQRSPFGAVAASPECDPLVVAATASEHGWQTALAPCGSNPVRWYAWSPDGQHLLFALEQGAYVVDLGADGAPTTRLPVDPAGPGAWAGPERVVMPHGAGLAVVSTSDNSVATVDLAGWVAPADLAAGPSGLLFTAVRDGRRRVARVDLADGSIAEPFPWADSLDRLAWQPAQDALVVARGDTVTLHDASGTLLGEWSGARAGALHPGGRWLALEDDVADAPPTVSIVDRVTGARWTLEGVRGTSFAWYEPRDYYGSLRLWGFDEVATPPNVALGDLGPAMARAEISFAAAGRRDPGR